MKKYIPALEVPRQLWIKVLTDPMHSCFAQSGNGFALPLFIYAQLLYFI